MSKKLDRDSFQEEYDAQPATLDSLEEARQYMQRRRPATSMHYQDPLHIPKELQPEGWSYYWIRDSVLGDPNFSRLAQGQAAGWRIVPSSRHPEMYMEDPFGRSSHLNGCIHRTGLILCERPEEWNLEDRYEYEKYNNELVDSMQGLKNFLGNNLFPVVANDSFAEAGQGYGVGEKARNANYGNPHQPRQGGFRPQTW